MRKVIVSIEISLDGVMENPQNWVFDYYGIGDEMVNYASAVLDEADALIMGRVTYEGFLAYWPEHGDDAFGKRINSLPKYVASRTLSEPLQWNATLLKDVVQEVKALKQQDGKAILQYGIGELTHTLIENGLVDEIRLVVCPVVISEGTRIFENFKRVPMKLLSSKSFSSGVQLVTYQPENAASS